MTTVAGAGAEVVVVEPAVGRRVGSANDSLAVDTTVSTGEGATDGEAELVPLPAAMVIAATATSAAVTCTSSVSRMDPIVVMAASICIKALTARPSAAALTDAR
jgi:hypothetical protein